MHLHAQGRPGGGRQGGHHILEGDAAPQRRGRCCERVRNLLDPVQREPDVGGAPGRRQPEPRSQVVVEHDALGPHLGVALRRIPEHWAGADLGHARHPLIVEIQDGDAGGRQRSHQLALGPGHTVEITEVLHVGHGDARHDADVRATHLGQARHVPRAAGAHLQDHPLGIVRCVEQGEREPQFVVEGPLARRHPKGRDKTLAQEILRRRLADRARDADHATVHVVACDQAQLHECGSRVRDDDGGRPDGFLRREVGRGSPFQGGADELVPVAFGDDWNVELACHCCPCVDGHSIDDDVGSDLLPTEAGGEFRNGESHASPSR